MKFIEQIKNSSKIKPGVSFFFVSLLLVGLTAAVYLIRTQESFDIREKAKELEKEIEIPISGRPAADYYTQYKLPPMDDRKMQAYCRMTSGKKEKYFQQKMAEAWELSDKLENYIRSWYRGEVAAEIPQGFLPASIDNEKTKSWKLLRPEEVKPEDQWYMRPANEIPPDFSKLYFLSPDNHVSYFKLLFMAPLDSQLLIEGDFPHARFMDYQILEPFDFEHPTTGGLGSPEVPIVDVDIEPDTEHVNPFRQGANRDAENRHYHLTFDLKAGNAVELNPQAMQAPAYRAPGNTRVGGPFAFTGPWGDGVIVPSVLWLRYYAPDKEVGALGGVGLPKALLRLKTGETFWLQSDFSLVAQRQTMAVPGFFTPPEEPKPLLGSTVGWLKMFGIWLAFADGYAYPWVKPWGPLPKSLATKPIQSRDSCYFGRGQEASPPGSYESSASTANYITYLVRPLSLGKGTVYVLTGKLPETPKTRDGEPVATTGEARYWSICHIGDGEDKKYPALLYGCLMDEEIKTNPDQNYIMVFSRRNEKPANAREECGVTWQDFGLESRQTFNIRWLSVIPDDYLPQYAPDQNNIPWETGEWSSPKWDPKIMSYNNQEGFMKEYQPLVHYLTKEEFESLGCPVDPQKVPKWK